MHQVQETPRNADQEMGERFLADEGKSKLYHAKDNSAAGRRIKLNPALEIVPRAL
jgi:hypothetical protein